MMENHPPPPLPGFPRKPGQNGGQTYDPRQLGGDDFHMSVASDDAVDPLYARVSPETRAIAH